MIRFYFRPTLNPAKVTVDSGGTGLPYGVVAADTSKGERPVFAAGDGFVTLDSVRNPMFSRRSPIASRAISRPCLRQPGTSDDLPAPAKGRKH